jgi:hypothetical protein
VRAAGCWWQLDQTEDLSHSVRYEHLAAQWLGQDVVSFEDLGRDAVLVVPLPAQRKQTTTYGSLAAFVRGASKLNSSGSGSTQPLSATVYEIEPMYPLWVSTDVRGVPVMHLRLDYGPKCIKHKPYMNLPWPRARKADID